MQLCIINLLVAPTDFVFHLYKMSRAAYTLRVLVPVGKAPSDIQFT
jgi:hypothetical protein